MNNFTHLLCLAVFSLLAASCGSSKTDTAVGTTGAEAMRVSEVSVEDSFGAPFTFKEVVPAPTFTDQYDVDLITDTVTTTLQGQINEVCQAKGCWMTIATGTESEMMVKFKDYAFFMPKDISGRQVIMNGKAYYQETSVDELRHYAEDAGKSADEIAMITKPKRELRFLADGVQLLRD